MNDIGRHDYGRVYRERIVDEAAEWFARLQDDEPGPDDRAAFGQWLRASAHHVREYLSLMALHADIAGLKSTPDAETLIALARSAGVENVTPLSPILPLPSEGRSGDRKALRSARRRFILPLGLAASVALLVFGAFWLHTNPDTAGYTTRRGEQKSLTLPDGSVVTLNALSELHLAFTQGYRDIELKSGEALFEVARNPARPFRVRSGDTVVQAVGTRFNVYHRQEDTTVTVVEGAVEVRSGEGRADMAKSAPVRVSRNQRAHVDLKAGAAARRVVVSAADAQAETAWRERRLVFESRALGAVVQEFNLYNDARLVVSDPKLEEVRVSGAFNANDPRSFAQFLQEARLAEFAEKADGTLELVARGASAP